MIVFALAVYLRSHVGQISGTEQPMDLMFLNAATRASHFPPKDPWLTGHDVAYYYFGYLIVAMTGRLAGVATDVAYNLGIAMIATMALVGAAGLVYNLVRMHERASARRRRETAAHGRVPLLMAAAGLRHRRRADARRDGQPRLGASRSRPRTASAATGSTTGSTYQA